MAGEEGEVGMGKHRNVCSGDGGGYLAIVGMLMMEYGPRNVMMKKAVVDLMTTMTTTVDLHPMTLYV